MPRALRIRNHVNPLSQHYAVPRARAIAIPAHLGPSPAVDVELGCADAQFSFQLAAAHPDRLVVALDIRRRIVEHGSERAAEAGLANLVLAYCNASVDLDRVLQAASVDRFHLLFPDPWFKPRHRKRRVIEPDALAAMRSRLRRGGELHVASDVFDVALAVMSELEADDAFANLAGPWRFWRGNPFGARSRREDVTMRRGERIWRVRYGRCTRAE
jgi:tRNA (guanine-N7-)-methyltransferase